MLTSATFLSEIQSSKAFEMDARIGSFAYVSLRVENRTQVNIEMLEARVSLLKQAGCIMQSISKDIHSQVVLLEDFVKLHPEQNPIHRKMPVIQVLANGRRRLGVQAICPRDSTMWPSTLPAEVLMAPDVRTDVESDWQLLIVLVQDSEKQQAALVQISEQAVKVEAEDDDDEGGLAGARMPAAEEESPQFPRGRLGNLASKTQNKVHGILLGIRGQAWKKHKDSSVRGHLRSVSGLLAELGRAEYPHLITIAEECKVVMEALLDVVTAEMKYKKDETIANLVPFGKPCDVLARALDKLMPGAVMDSELLVLQVRCGA